MAETITVKLVAPAPKSFECEMCIPTQANPFRMHAIVLRFCPHHLSVIKQALEGAN